jgi:phosphatidylglycerol---prolipoprotein diacylglyceryl transferase
LARAAGLPLLHIELLALASCLVGIVGAKVYYRLTHLGEPQGPLTTGASLQGFVIGALSVLALGSALWQLPMGTVLDVTAPALLLGQAIGRIGCFFGGCCTGLPTTSRWGLWSSDRRIGVRRIPVQLMESASAAVLAIASIVALRSTSLFPQGLVFVAGISAYVIVRQLLFPLRGVPRKTAHGRIVTLVLASAALIGACITAFVL